MIGSSEAHEFSENVIRVFSIIGRQIGSSIKTAELLQQLRISKDDYDLISIARDVIYTHNIDGKFLSMNHAGLELLGCTMKELRRCNISDFLSEDSQEMMDCIKECLIQGTKIEFPPVLEVISKHGKRSFYEFNIIRVSPVFLCTRTLSD